jgi:hypothetical protein
MTWKKNNKYMISKPYPLSLERCTAARKLITYKIVIGKWTSSILDVAINNNKMSMQDRELRHGYQSLGN